MANPTTNFTWALPLPGGSTGAWGPILNDAFQAIDTQLNTTNTTAAAALPKAGGTMTGRVAVYSSDHLLVSLTGTEMDLAVGNVFYKTIGGTTTFTITGVQATRAVFWMLELTNGGSQTVSFPAAVNWAGGTAPTLTASGVDILGFYSRDGGTTVYGFPLALDSK